MLICLLIIMLKEDEFKFIFRLSNGAYLNLEDKMAELFHMFPHLENDRVIIRKMGESDV